MSFLNKINVPLINSKITAIGRQKIAEGGLNFKYYSLGDSQLEYHNLSGSQNILKPKDKNPSIKTYLTKVDCAPFQPLDGVKVLECCIHNRAKERGFFDENDDYSLKLSSKYIKHQGTVLSQQLNGTRFINIGTNKFADGDFILFKIANYTSGYVNAGETDTAIPYLFFQITKSPAKTTIELDRNMPFLNYSELPINFYIFSKDINYYSTTNANTLWDYEDLNFQIECLEEDTFIWNMNILWGENVIGTQTNQQQFQEYCSYNYLGQKEYLGYNLDCPDLVASGDCENKLLGVDDDYVKSIGIIHYTNTNKSNLYGEQFHISDPQHVKIHLKSLMWHQRYFSGGTATGNDIGMTFIADTTKKYISNTNIAYYDLVEDPSLISPNKTASIVGRIFADLQIIVIHHPDLLAALSYKSNRNFTLPKLVGKMVSPSNSNIGVLPKGKTMYMTYTFEANSNIQHILPQQQYLKFINNGVASRDVEFSLEDANLLPYMRQLESSGYDGLGFSFHKFKILYQIVDNGLRPLSESWKAIDYTNNFLVDFIGNTINPFKLEVQNVAQTGFLVNDFKVSLSTPYNLSILSIPDENCPYTMGFGCETFLFGNIDLEIGACTYKSIFEIVVDSDIVVKSTNPTWNTNQNLKMNELGIYDDKYNLVWFNSFYEQIELNTNTKTLIEIQMDF